eukprot:XP_016865336.1 cyclin-J-like protein isoform X3 [Homo sapiens]
MREARPPIPPAREGGPRRPGACEPRRDPSARRGAATAGASRAAEAAVGSAERLGRGSNRRQAPEGTAGSALGGARRSQPPTPREDAVRPESRVASDSGAAYAMMDEPWWEGRVASDVHCTLREKELKLPTFRAHSPLLKSRRFFVDILTLLSSHCQLCPAARHLAVYLLDHFMDRYNVTTSKQLYTVAVSCLLLANHIFYKFQPSVVAAACVGASRICLQLSPYWTRDLQRISSYSLEHLSTCIEILLVVYDNVLKDAVAVKSQALAMVPGTPPTPTQVLFQPPAYPALGQPATTLAQFQTPVQDLCLAYRDSLQAHRSGSLLSGSTGSSLHTPYQPLQPLDMCPVPVPASLSMHMAIAAEPRHCLATTYGSSYFSGSHMFPTGCFDR